MKMLRVGLVASNFLEAPNGGGAGGNQQPASSSSLRERCGGRGINLHAAPNDSRAVALRTREHLAELHQAQPATLWCAKGGTGSAKSTKLLQTGADLTYQQLRPPQYCCEAILTVGY
jgi:hypothetical protein